MNANRAELYRLTFPNGKIYIGATTKTAIERFNRHCIVANHKSKSWAVHRAINKYGKNSIKVETLIVGYRDYIFDMECKAIEMFKSQIPFGYNMTSGGDGVSGHSEETLEKLRLANIGKKMSPANLDKLISANTGRVVSVETRLKISMANIGKKRSPEQISAMKITHAFISAETRLKMSISATGKKPSELTRAKIGSYTRNRIDSAETRLKKSLSAKGKNKSPESIAKRVATMALKKQNLSDSELVNTVMAE